MAERHPQLLDVQRTQLLVVDLQERLVPVVEQHESLVGRAALAIRGARELGVPIVVTEQYPKGLGETVPSIREALGACPAHEKLSFSVGGCAPAMRELADNDRPAVLVVGIETHVCVLQTVLDLLHANYEVYPAVDAIGSRHARDRAPAIERMTRAGAVATTVEAALFELLREAGTDVFKAISKLVKGGGNESRGGSG
jgi:nicotinamidase-related amidase